MRRQFVLAAAIAAIVGAVPVSQAFAQGQPQDSGQDDAAAKRRRDSEWGNNQAPLPQMRNAGPCPFVKTLYDASRYVEFKDGREASGNVGFTGEIQNISAGCQYKDAEPIKVMMEALFELGRGPQAQGQSKTYRYWIAVTDRNREVIAKQTFDMPVTFGAGEDRVYMTETINQIVIPRVAMTTSGSNFEILIGFEVTPEMAAFNRDGKRFRLNAGSTVAAATTSAGSAEPNQ